MLLKFSNFPDELSKNDELREYELNGSDCKISLMNNWSELPENLTKGFSAGLKMPTFSDQIKWQTVLQSQNWYQNTKLGF